MNRWTFAAAFALALPPPMPVLSGRDLLYLDLAFRQTRQFERTMPHLGPERLGSAALEAAALASAGKSAGRSTAADAERYLTAGLDACTGQWHKVHCERMLLAFQRVALQFPAVVPEPLLTRLRTQAAIYVPPPGEAAVRDPWNFQETENGRIVRMARCLAALQVDPGEPGSAREAAAQAWGEATAAFLRAHDRDGWYEAESPGYTATSITALLQIADHAPQPAVRLLARRQLDLLFADWAQRSVGGFPAGPKSRSYVHWSLGAGNTPWLAWAWMAAGLGDVRSVWLMDWPEIATSGYGIPEPVARLLAGRRRQPAYEIRIRRRISLTGRRELDTALYSFATPDYILGSAQSLRGLSLGVSGGQEIMATLYPAGREFAPLYLWSRTQNVRADRWKSWAGHDFTVGARNVVLARLAFGSESEGDGTGHAYLSAPWEPPQRVGDDVVVSRYGDTYVALVTAGGWDVEPAPRRFPRYYGGDPAYANAWVAVPRIQPAAVALEVGRRSEIGSFRRWRERAATARLATVDGELRYAAAGGARIDFLPGEWASVDGRLLDVSYPLVSGPFLSNLGAGEWMFSFGTRQIRFAKEGGAEAPP
jgi:hypothetical protein